MKTILRSALAVLFALGSACAPPAATAAEPTNLLPNPGFEAGLAGWEPAGDPLCALDTVVVHSGAQSLRLAPRPEAAGADLLKVCATVPATPGETYRARFWVRAGPLADGSEPYGALEFMAGEQRLGLAHTDFGVNRYEPNAWHQLQVLGVVPPGASAVRLAMILHPHAVVWFDAAELIRLRPAPAPESVAVRLALSPVETLTADWRGFGCQGEILLHLQRSLQQGYSAADHGLIEDRIRAMRPQFIRLTVRLSDWQPELERTTPDNDTISDLKATIALYKEVGADVQLTEWGHALPDWCRPTGRLPHPEMYPAFAASWAALLRHLRRDCGLTNVRYVTLHNEPNGLPWADYRALCRALAAALTSAGIRPEVQIIGPDESGENLLLPLAIRDLDDVLDAYDAHGYTANTGAEFALWVEAHTGLLESRPAAGAAAAAQPGRPAALLKPFLITEFGMADGMDTWQTPHNDEVRYGLFLADAALVACNLGVSGMAMYCISDYDCGTKMKWGLWKGRDEQWEPRPGFYAWSLITRNTALGSTVHPLRSDAGSVPAVAFRAPGAGAWTLLAVNRLASPRPLTLVGLPPGSIWAPFVYSATTVPTPDRGPIAAGQTLAADAQGVLTTVLAADAFAVWRELDRTRP
jgi:alpha-galactosidase